MILKCKGNCYHRAQDEMHGFGLRVCNRAPKQNGFRCTVCGTIQAREGRLQQAQVAKTKKED